MEDFEAFARLVTALRPWLGQLVVVGGWAHRLHRFHPRANPHREAVVLHRQGRLVEAPAVADLAGHVDVGQEVHLDALHPVALAGLAAAALHVEGEAAGGVAVHPRLGQLGEEVADEVEELGVGVQALLRRMNLPVQ